MSVMELIKGFSLDFSLMGFLGERKKPKPHTQMKMSMSAQLASLKKSEFLGCFGKPLLFVRVLVQMSGCYEKQRNMWSFVSCYPEMCVYLTG